MSGRRPWYNGAYNDDINPASTTPWGQTYNTAFGMEEQTGQKQYELTNPVAPYFSYIYSL